MFPFLSKIAILVVSLFLASCSSVKSPIKEDPTLFSLLYVQHAAEWKAMYHQAYNLAHYRLKQELTKTTVKKKAVVLDVDETVLDNSPHNGRLSKLGLSHPAGWKEWVDKAEAKPVPGVKSFLKFADENNIAIFYVTNRHERYKKATINNLKKMGFPQVSSGTVLCRVKESTKKPRRDAIRLNHQIVLLIGDNLGDLHEAFETRDPAGRDKMVENLYQQFGKRFILLPNPLYGSWLGALPGKPGKDIVISH